MKKELNKIVSALDEDEKFELEARRRDQERLRELEISREKFVPTIAPIGSMNATKEKLPYVFDAMESGNLVDVIMDRVKVIFAESN